jgi:hypothetical protein
VAHAGGRRRGRRSGSRRSRHRVTAARARGGRATVARTDDACAAPAVLEGTAGSLDRGAGRVGNGRASPCPRQAVPARACARRLASVGSCREASGPLVQQRPSPGGQLLPRLRAAARHHVSASRTSRPARPEGRTLRSPPSARTRPEGSSLDARSAASQAAEPDTATGAWSRADGAPPASSLPRKIARVARGSVPKVSQAVSPGRRGPARSPAGRTAAGRRETPPRRRASPAGRPRA